MSDTTNSADSLQRFSFDNTNIRGELAHVNASYREVLKRHQCQSRWRTDVSHRAAER